MPAKATVIDCNNHMLGRLASVVAKQLLIGNYIVCVRCEEITISGGLVRQKMKFQRFLRKRTLTQPADGPFHFRAPARILWRTIRGMIPHKTKRGAAALERLKCFEGVPAPYDKMKRVVVPAAIKVLRLQHGRRFCKLHQLSSAVGWKQAEVVKQLEEKRKAESEEFYKEKKRLAKLRARAIAQVEAGEVA
eukprot:TRINITY_DN29905_c0_g1_i4.p2 TRINITY_DN29905_c0_g1~~TRINITY_DN29905_c0_g1_i4.p2  ORF type:complete len:210 (-),score=34.56 TRINITY_DN29905_c0_g1_i4:132-704(-)